jgi:hypothetical protein
MPLTWLLAATVSPSTDTALCPPAQVVDDTRTQAATLNEPDVSNAGTGWVAHPVALNVAALAPMYRASGVQVTPPVGVRLAPVAWSVKLCPLMVSSGHTATAGDGLETRNRYDVVMLARPMLSTLWTASTLSPTRGGVSSTGPYDAPGDTVTALLAESHP